MSRFPTAGHFIAWAGSCPDQNESAGERRRAGLRKGAPWLKTMLVHCAWAAKRANNSYYKAQYFPPASQTRPAKSHLRRRRLHLDCDLSHAQGRNRPQRSRRGLFRPPIPESKAERLARQIAKLGYEVTLQPRANAA